MGILFIFSYVILILIVVEISSILLIVSGLDKKIARFQAISMLTSTGFTTKESELILRHPIRRNIAMFLILFGVFSLAVLISSISGIIKESFRMPQLIMITIGMLLLWVAVKNKSMMNLLSRRFQEQLRQDFELHELPVEEVLYTSEEDLVIGIPVFSESGFVNRSSDEVIRTSDDMIILFIQRGNEKLRRHCRKQTVKEGDILYVYGSREAIENKFSYELIKMKIDLQNERQISGI